MMDKIKLKTRIQMNINYPEKDPLIQNEYGTIEAYNDYNPYPYSVKLDNGVRLNYVKSDEFDIITIH